MPKITMHQVSTNQQTSVYQESWGRVRPLMVDLFEDFWAFILVLLFVSLGAITTHYILIIIRSILGEMPASIELVLYAGNWSIGIRYYLYTLHTLKKYKGHN